MDARLVSICIGAITLAAGGIIYGTKFLKKGNYLLGAEWWILAISSTNFLIYELTHWHFNYLGVILLDTFSRAFGIPIVATIGLMVLTHRYRPSIMADIAYFVIPLAGTILILIQFSATILAYFLAAMWPIFTLFLFYFAYRLMKVDETGHAVAVILVAITNQAIAGIYDFYKIPGEETNIIFNFYTIALFVWTFLTVQIYYSYCAFERTLERQRQVAHA